jgi:hypothetical protein
MSWHLINKTNKWSLLFFSLHESNSTKQPKTPWTTWCLRIAIYLARSVSKYGMKIDYCTRILGLQLYLPSTVRDSQGRRTSYTYQIQGRSIDGLRGPCHGEGTKQPHTQHWSQIMPILLVPTEYGNSSLVTFYCTYAIFKPHWRKGVPRWRWSESEHDERCQLITHSYIKCAAKPVTEVRRGFHSFFLLHPPSPSSSSCPHHYLCCCCKCIMIVGYTLSN